MGYAMGMRADSLLSKEILSPFKANINMESFS